MIPKTVSDSFMRSWFSFPKENDTLYSWAIDLIIIIDKTEVEIDDLTKNGLYSNLVFRLGTEDFQCSCHSLAIPILE